MDMSEFHRCVELLMGRPVWSHEFARMGRLLAEYRGEADPPLSPLHSLVEVMGGKEAASKKKIVVLETE